MSDLGREGIIKGLENNDIHISPFNEKQLKSNSYDFKLGNEILRPKLMSELIGLKGVELKRVKTVTGIEDCYFVNPNIANFEEFYYKEMISEDSPLLLRSGETVLATTFEEIGAVNSKYTTSMSARSTVARLFIRVCACGGTGDSGFTNRWTIELENCSKWNILLYPKTPIGQIKFISTKDCDSTYNNDTRYNENSRYNEERTNIYNSMFPKQLIVL